jgi:hypothetical protein
LRQAGFQVDRLYSAGFPFFNLFRLLIAWRGEKLIKSVSGRPSLIVRLAMWVFDLLFRFNLMRWGWQSVAVARPAGDDACTDGTHATDFISRMSARPAATPVRP